MIALFSPPAGGVTVAQPAIDPSNLAAFVTEASQRFGIPEAWIVAVIDAESRNNPNARSAKGALGLMQLMPSTWTILRAQLQLGDNPLDAHDNIIAGTAYLRLLFDRYGARGFLGAYNAGPGRYEAAIKTGSPLPAETISYVATIRAKLRLTDDQGIVLPAPIQTLSWTSSALFIDTASVNSHAPARPALAPEKSPFVNLVSPADRVSAVIPRAPVSE